MEFVTGYRGINKQNLEYEVMDGTIAHKTIVRFLIDDAEVITTRSYLREGLPCHPTYGRIIIGKVYKDNKGNDFEILERISKTSWKIRFVKDGEECIRESNSIRKGTVKHPSDGVPTVGKQYVVKRGTVTVISYKNAFEVLVRFEDGSLQTTTSQDLRTGFVSHPTSDLYIGQKFKTNSGWEGEVIEYKSCYDVGVKWQDGSIDYHPASHIKNGGIKPLYQPSVCGVGYIGQGRFSSGGKTKGETAPKEIHAYWQRMISRCFNPEEIIKNSGRRYVFVNIHKDWFCFQNFAEWAIKQPNWNKKFDLDKDLLGDGLEYSEQSCTFLPADVNVFLADNWTKDVHDLPIGVQYIKPGTTGAKVGYVSRCHTDKGREYLGYFDDPMDAYLAYKNAKEKYALVLAERYKSDITEKAYNSLLNFKLDQLYCNKPHVCGDV